MRINAKLVCELRATCAWSQDELATAAGVNLRTIQRIENLGSASLQSAKAIASALEVELDDLKPTQEITMSKYEYKTVVLPFKFGIFKQGVPDIKAALTKEGQDGWQFKQMILPSSDWGKSDNMIAILERVIE
jgi:DNA-binding XRE family transcriptional regulator